MLEYVTIILFLFSIGRAIRHINDYSTIVLLDKRYGRTSVQTKLPEWIRSCLQTHTQFGTAFGALKKVIYSTYCIVDQYVLSTLACGSDEQHKLRLIIQFFGYTLHCCSDTTTIAFLVFQWTLLRKKRKVLKSAVTRCVPFVKYGTCHIVIFHLQQLCPKYTNYTWYIYISAGNSIYGIHYLTKKNPIAFTKLD